MRYFYTFLVIVFAFSANAQSFIFNQFFRPSIRINTLYAHDFNLSNKDRLHVGQVNINCIVPIANKFKVDVDWKNLLKLRLKKATKLKLYQIFWNFRPKMLYINLTYQNAATENPFRNKPHFAYGFSTGITGIHVLAKPMRKPKLLFYQFNVGMMEDYRSVQTTPIPSLTALVGMAHVKGFNLFWYYGLYFAYDNGQVVPAPFFGLQARLGKKAWVNITIPVQLKFAFKVSNKFKIDIGAGLSGFNTAFGYLDNTGGVQRHVFSAFRLRTGTTFNIKLSKQATLYIEAGAYPYQVPIFRWHKPTFTKPELSPTFYGGLSLYYSFKKALLGSVVDGIIMF